MTEKISQYLHDIEEEKAIKILLACEAGSRAWGFPSIDSDYDIRMIYVHKKDWYLSLSEKKDTIERMFENNDIDITGWDLRKSLRLLRKSNPPLLERIQSSILYKYDKDFLNEINELAITQYSRLAAIHHYFNMAKKFLKELKEEETYKLKKFFYALRSAIACKWILERSEIPPLEFQKMMNGLSLENSLLERINELIKLKATVNESYLHKGEDELINFIETCIHSADERRNSLPSSNGKMEAVNSFFVKTITQNDH